jgi:hypothetical protein
MTEIHFDFLNFNNILLLLVILAIGGYLYYEIHKMKISINDIHNKLNILMNSDKEISLGEVVVDKNEILSQEEFIITKPIIDQSMNIQDEYQEINPIQKQMDMNDLDDSRSESSDDSRSGGSDDSRSESSDTESRISQSEIEKDYGKNAFEQENNTASIDDILSDKHIITDNSLSDILNVDSDLTKIDEFIQNIKGETTTEDMSTKDMPKDYNDMTVSELKKVLVDMKLPVSGNKTKLIERILGNKK